MKNALLRIAIFLFTAVSVHAQIPFDVYIEPHPMAGMPGVHSYAYAEYGNKILLVGGRKDGPHRRQPNQSFLAADNNLNFILINLDNNTVITRSINSLSTALQEQLQSTNMQSAQKGDYAFGV